MNLSFLYIIISIIIIILYTLAYYLLEYKDNAINILNRCDNTMTTTHPISLLHPSMSMSKLMS